jgi:uncharacterized membrane protein YjjP (DUF1212 family)
VIEATGRASHESGGSDAVAFLLRFTEVGHAAGYPTDDLPFGTMAAQRSYTFRVRPRPVDLDAIARIDDVVHDVLGGADPGEALARLEEIRDRPLERAWFERLAAYALAGAAVTPVLGGGWRDVIAGGIVGLVVGGIALLARCAARTEVMLAPLAAIGASFSAAVIAYLGLRTSPDIVTLAALVTLLAAIAAGLAFTVTLRAQSKAAPVMCSATVLAVLANAVGRALLGAAAGVFVAALAIGAIGGLVSGMLRRSPLVFIVPGVLILVPGSAGFNSLLKLLTGQTVSGIDAGFNTFVTAMAIAYGLMLSTVILPQRFTRIDSGGTVHV